jgi:uncharacterized protein YdeI (YjbR/CyaY-like superfamily)
MILYIDNRDDWRAWLQRNHDAEKEVWQVYYKKHTGKPRIPYEDAVEEAKKFTPRKDKGNWSAINKIRARKMILEGKMTDAGLARIQDLSEVARTEPEDLMIKEASKKAEDKSAEVPQLMMEALIANGHAWENFNKLAASYQRNYILCISSAKKEETRQRRLKEAIGLLEQGRKLGMKWICMAIIHKRSFTRNSCTPCKRCA